MMKLIFDLETDGLLDTFTQIHSLVIKDIESGIIYSCTDNFYVPKDPKIKLWTIKDGIELLKKADLIIGHNIIKFDIPVIKKLFPGFAYKSCYDTLIASRTAYPDIIEMDFRYRNSYQIPAYLKNKPYSLEAWGIRLKLLKGSYGKQENAWESWNAQMQEYCEQDIKVTEKLYQLLIEPKNPLRFINDDILETEQEFAKIIHLQEGRGVKFNEIRAKQLLVSLEKRRAEIVPDLRKYFKDKIKKTSFIPKRNNKTKGYVKGVPAVKKKLIPFNPQSKEQIKEQLLLFYNWKPQEFTENKTPKLDGKAIESMCENIKQFPFAKILDEFFIITKLLGQLSEGEKSWLNYVKDGVIYGKLNCQGTVTHRCTHNNPNLAQIPSVEKPFGAECRELFEAREGYNLVGVDASGLELRCLAHYMNDDEFTELILNGDIHTFNMNILKEAAPNITRAIAKTWIYRFLYGGGNDLLGSTVGKARKVGKLMRETFLAKLPKLAELVKKVEADANRGYLFTIDDRRIPLSSKHVALNYLLQSTGAIVMKRALIILHNDLLAKGWEFGREFAYVLNVHDEIQAEVKPELAEEYSTIAVEAIRKAGVYYGFRCPLDGEAKIGLNWRDTH